MTERLIMLAVLPWRCVALLGWATVAIPALAWQEATS